MNYLPEPTSVKGVRSFIGMVNFPHDFLKGLSSHMIPLTALTKKRSASEPFKINCQGQAAFAHIKGLMAKSSQTVIMNEEDPLILYTDASTKAIGGVLMQLQNGIVKPVIFASHILSDQATRWRIIEQELYAFVHCVKQLGPYLLGKFEQTIRTCNICLTHRFLNWCVVDSCYRSTDSSSSIFLDGDQNIIADGLTRVNTLIYNDVDKSKRHLYQNDSISRISRLGGEGIEENKFPGVVNEGRIWWRGRLGRVWNH